MKIIIVLIVFLISYHSEIFSQEEWFWQNPLPQGNHIQKIISIDENNIVAGGLKGFFIKSTDSVLSWNVSYLSENYSLSRLKYFSPDNILFAFVGDLVVGGTMLYKSSDKGSSWDSIFTFNNWGPTDIDKNSENILYGVGGSGKIYKSNDYGYNWDSIPSVTNKVLNAINFIDDQNGCIVGRDGIILRTSDNGNTWSIIQSGITEALYSLDFLDSMNGIAVGQRNYTLQENSILKTTDGGLTWVKMLGSNPLGELLDVEFIDLENIIIVGGNDDYFGGREPIVMRSSDGGENWIDLSSQFSRGINSISFYNLTTAVCAGFAGGIYKTNDSGNNWTKLNNGFFSSFDDICTFDSSDFYTIGIDHGTNEVIFLYTDNGGEVWQTKNAPSFVDVRGLDFLDENYGMITGDNSIFYTLDGCNTWNQGTTPPSANVRDVEIISNSKAFLSGDQGTLLKSSDGGNTWFSVNSNTTGNLERIVFKDLLNGLIIVNSGSSIKTTDGGENWNAINYNFGWLWNGAFFGSNNIALAGSQGTIYISKDGGQTWIEKIVASSGTYISSISFKDSLNGIAVGETGLILYTTDGGDTWNEQFSPTLTDLIDIEYSKNNFGVLIGKDGVILGTKKGIQIVGVDDKQANLLPNKFYLSQNYPNPFNPSTTIKFSIPVSLSGVEGSLVTIKIYNALGEEVAVLFDKEFSTGTYEVEWNATGFPSGVYFYQLQTNGFLATKKMLLLK